MPKGKTTTTKKKESKVKEENKNEEVDIQNIIAKVVAEELAKQELKLKSEFDNKLKQIEKEKIHDTSNSGLLEKEDVLNRSKIKGKLGKFVPDEARVRIEFNMTGKFVFADRRGSNYFAELNGYRDSITVSFRDLKNFHGKNPAFLNRGKIIITDVLSDAEIDVWDVIEDLGLKRLYTNDDIIKPFEIEDYLSDKMPMDDFSQKLQNSTQYLEVIVEVAMILFKRGQFLNNDKMNKFREILRKPQLFTNY